ncbi:MAG TPA: metallophosphoesterase [Polyangia bacterium]|nr:metallophosphoesterase [Polyangia bacterium]
MIGKVLSIPDLRKARRTKMLAHLSDLHMGRSAEDDAQAEALARALVEIGIDHVLVTGDVTHRGRRREWELFEDAFERLSADGRLTVVPGNHDRLGDDMGDTIMPGARVQTVTADGLYIVRVNSTGDHNRSWIQGHGILHEADLDAVDAALDETPRDHLAVIALHHHVVPLPEEHAAERLSNFLNLPFTIELGRGRELLQRLRGRCGLVLHGHRHVPRGVRLQEGMHTVRIFNAGSSTILGGARVFEHAGGVLVNSPWWLESSESPGQGVSWAATPTVSHDREWRVA